MKLKEKIKESIVLKLALALIVPGGLIVWGIYEIREKFRHNDGNNPSPDQVKDGIQK